MERMAELLVPEQDLKVVDHEDSFKSVEDAWNKILDSMENQQVFYTPVWAQTWWRHLGSGKLHLLSIQHARQTIAVAPLVQRARTAYLIGDKDVCDYLDVLIMPGQAEKALEALRRYGTERNIRLDLFPMHPGSPLVGIISRLMEQGEQKVCREHLDFSFILDVPASWEDYLILLSKKDRHELRRKINKLERAEQVSFYSAEPSPGNMDDFFTLFRKRGEKASFLTRNRELFFRDMAAELGNRGWLKLYFLEIEGKRVAVTLCFNLKGTLSLYNSGYDPSYSQLSVGLVAKAWTIQESIKMGAKKFDFLRGAEEYKENLGGKQIRIYRCTMDP